VAAYVRDAYLGPKVFAPKGDPANIPVNEGTSVTFTAIVWDPDNDLDTVTIDLTAIGQGVQNMTSGPNGLYSYTTTVSPSTSGYLNFTITATDGGGLTGQGTVTITAGTFVIIDNLQGIFTGSWPVSGSLPGFYGSNYQFHVLGAGTDYFRWTPTIPTAGTYEVFARWTAEAARAPDATYTVYHDGGNTPVQKDQRTQGAQWVSLGTFTLDGAGDYVQLAQSPNGAVCADAIMWTLQP